MCFTEKERLIFWCNLLENKEIRQEIIKINKIFLERSKIERVVNICTPITVTPYISHHFDDESKYFLSF